MLYRLGFAIHWIGFTCLVLFLGLVFWGIIIGEISIAELPTFVVDTLLDFSRVDEADYWFILLAITHWPIKWMLTDNKSFFPWKS